MCLTNSLWDSMHFRNVPKVQFWSQVSSTESWKDNHLIPLVGFCSVNGLFSCLFISVLERDTPFYFSPWVWSYLGLCSVLPSHHRTNTSSKRAFCLGHTGELLRCMALWGIMRGSRAHQFSISVVFEVITWLFCLWTAPAVGWLPMEYWGTPLGFCMRFLEYMAFTFVVVLSTCFGFCMCVCVCLCVYVCVQTYTCILNTLLLIPISKNFIKKFCPSK